MTHVPASASLIFAEGDLESPQVHGLASGTAAVFTARCPGSTRSNEDAAALVPIDAENAIIVIADGAGGAPLGERAARLAVEHLVESLHPLEGHPPRELILRGFDRANEAVIGLGVGAATTLAVVEVGPTWLRTYHAGDSAILVTGQRGKLKLLTMAHSPVGYAVEAGLLDEDAAMHHEDRNLVSNMVGTAGMRVEMGSPLGLSERDTVVLGTDGLFDNLAISEIVECVRIGQIDAAAAALASACRERMNKAESGAPSKPDDLTFVLFRR